MKKFFKLLIFTAVLFSYFGAYGINLKLKKDNTPMVNYNVWVKSESFPKQIEGVEQYYPSTEVQKNDDGSVDTIAVVKGTISLPGLTAQQAFLAALVYVTENMDKDNKEGFEKIDYNKNSFVVILKSKQGRNDKETTYTRTLSVEAKNDGLKFETTEIDCQYREKKLIPRTLRLEKLHPEKNARHAELVKEFVDVNSKYLAQLGDYAKTRKDIKSPNFEKLKKGGSAEIGMTQDEVIILEGAPLDKRKSGEKTRWVYSTEYIIIFTNGKVSKIIN